MDRKRKKNINEKFLPLGCWYANGNRRETFPLLATAAENPMFPSLIEAWT